jgi:peptidoglycan/LPS O-acetylase OafA/YrhL
MAIDTTSIETHPGALDLTDRVALPATPPSDAPETAVERWPATPADRVAQTFQPSVRYLPALDGMRALAVASVLLYHGDVSWIPGGFLGVEVFFVISGYLITSLLLAERESTGGTAYLAFWARRARRLLPALFAMLAVVSAVWLLKVPGEAARIRGDIVGALTYITNWYQIVVRQSYFEAIGRPSPLRHLWSLAVEEQFYLVWPIVLAGLSRVTRGRRGHLLVIIGGLAAASAAWGVRLYHPGLDPSRVYYGTDTRAAGVLLGAALAVAAPPWLMRAKVHVGARALFNVVGGVGLVGIGWMMVKANEFDPMVYQGGFVVLDVFAVAAVAAVVHPCATIWSKILGVGPLVWIGKRSYGIYLWHWPIFVLTRPGLDVTASSGTLLALRLGLTVSVAEISYRLIELPVRQGALRRLWARRSLPDGPLPRRARRQVVGGALVALALIATLLVGLVNARPNTTISGVDLAGATTDDLGNVVDETSLPPVTTAAPTTTAVTGVPVVVPLPPPPTVPPPPAIVPIPGNAIIAVGDSVLLGARGMVRNQFPNILINAEVGRQFNVLPGLIPALANVGALRPNVIVHLGTNGPPTDGDLGKILDALAGANKVVLVTTREPRSWQDLTNQRLGAAAMGRSNVAVVDWYLASEGHPEYFVADGVHLTQVGAQAYAVALASAFR